MEKVDWKEIFKVRPRVNASTKHEIIKLLIVLKLLERHKRNLYWIRIYTEWDLGNGKTCDVYFENRKTKEAIAFEIQKNVTKKWIKETSEKYKDWEVYLMKSDWILVETKKLSDNIQELEEQVEEYIN